VVKGIPFWSFADRVGGQLLEEDKSNERGTSMERIVPISVPRVR